MTLSVNIRHQFDGFSLDLSFEAGAGITALFGRSGAGKTTAINAIAGLLHPQEGQITLNGQVLLDTAQGLFQPPAKRKLGYVFQDARLFPHLTVEQNLTFGQRYADPNAVGVTLTDVVELLGIGTLLSRAPATLSGGEKQRVAIGRALLCKPQLLLMDEPLASLDAPRKQEILPYLEHLRDADFGPPILYVSHSVDEFARLADQIVLLKDGKVSVHGPVFEVMSDPAALPLFGVREAGAILKTQVVAHHEDGLTSLKCSAGQLHLPGVQAAKGSELRLRVLAQDVMIALDKPQRMSAMNVLPVVIETVHPGDGPGAAIALRAGEDRLLARVTRRAVSELGLKPGLSCYAVIKATSVAPGNIGQSPKATLPLS